MRLLIDGARGRVGQVVAHVARGHHQHLVAERGDDLGQRAADGEALVSVEPAEDHGRHDRLRVARADKGQLDLQRMLEAMRLVIPDEADPCLQEARRQLLVDRHLVARQREGAVGPDRRPRAAPGVVGRQHHHPSRDGGVGEHLAGDRPRVDVARVRRHDADVPLAAAARHAAKMAPDLGRQLVRAPGIEAARHGWLAKIERAACHVRLHAPLI